MKLSEYKKKNLTNTEIENIVFSNISDNNESCYYGIVFGHKMLFKERTEKAIEMYNKGRIKK